MTTPHTPGPWKVDEDAPVIVSAQDGTDIAIASGRAERGTVQEANARLIAAAPEMLAALVILVRDFDSAVDHAPEYSAIADHARAAIAKARGET